MELLLMAAFLLGLYIAFEFLKSLLKDVGRGERSLSAGGCLRVLLGTVVIAVIFVLGLNQFAKIGTESAEKKITAVNEIVLRMAQTPDPAQRRRLLREIAAVKSDHPDLHEHIIAVLAIRSLPTVESSRTLRLEAARHTLSHYEEAKLIEDAANRILYDKAPGAMTEDVDARNLSTKYVALASLALLESDSATVRRRAANQIRDAVADEAFSNDWRLRYSDEQVREMAWASLTRAAAAEREPSAGFALAAARFAVMKVR